MSNLTVHGRLAPKKQPASPGHASAPRSSDAPTPSVTRSDAFEPAAISPVGEGSSKAPSETPIEGEGTEGESSGGAFNPETGEINWDCPCLGGMAHGPCGQQFREAFSCFVYSEADPKGIDCVEKFKAMQDCFREHPDVYGDGTWICFREYATMSFSPQKLWTTMRRNLLLNPRPPKKRKMTISSRIAFPRRGQRHYQPPHHPRIMDLIDTAYSGPRSDLLHS